MLALHGPLILSRSEHSLSRRDVDSDALKVMYRLIRHGYKAFLVGGAVRDLLLGKEPKDYDIGTDARPEAIRSLFRNSRVIGRRFRIIHVYFKGNKILEVSTFRALNDPESQELQEGKPITDDNTYGDPESDAKRRDLTINGLFYDLSSFSVIDYVGGIQDLRDEVVRMIGEPEGRILEDPVRMIRAVRHAARADFRLEEETRAAIERNVKKIHLSSTSRLHEEFLRDLRGGESEKTFDLYRDTGLLDQLVPVLLQGLQQEPGAEKRFRSVLRRTDKLVEKNPDPSMAAVLAALLVGNIPSSPESYDPSLEPALPYLQLAPAEDSRIHKVRVPLLHEEQRIRGKLRRKRGPQKRSPLAQLLTDLYSVFTITRRQREDMEALLLLRCLCHGRALDDRSFSRIRESRLPTVLLQFLELLKDNEEDRLALEWCRPQLSKPRRKKKGGRKRGGSSQQRRKQSLQNRRPENRAKQS